MSASLNRCALHGAGDVIPVGALIVEPKYCENCGRPFFRKQSATVPRLVPYLSDGRGFAHVDQSFSELRADHGARYCKPCMSRHLMPDVESQEEYRAQMPGSDEQMSHRHLHLPRYDDSLVPKKPSRRVAY
jgi:hypothetical protein